jgi:hypothetical protein
MKPKIISYVVLIGSIISILLMSNYGAFTKDYLMIAVVGIIISGGLMHLISKRNQPEVKILPVNNPNLINSFSIASFSVFCFQACWEIISKMNPLYGMNNDYSVVNLILTFTVMILPASFLGAFFWECSRSKSRKIIWFPSVIFGFVLFMLVLSGIVG